MKRLGSLLGVLVSVGACSSGGSPANGDATTVAAGSPASGSGDGPADAGTSSSFDGSKPDAGSADATAATGGIDVVESTDPNADWACTDRATCVADYDALISKAAAFGKPITQAQLDAQIQALDDGNVPLESSVLSASQLRDRIIAGANVGFLLDGIDARPTKVITRATTISNGVIERDLVFVDPFVGTFKGILLTPEGLGPFPAVVAIHGHPDDAEIYRDDYHAKDFPGRGYAILMLTMRAMAIDASEHQITMDLLKGGFTLVGMRVYETLLGFKYLRYLAQKDASINDARVGLIGHSGGSSASDLTVRIEPRFKAYVSDNSVDWHRSDSDWDKLTGNIEPYHCETVPALYPINEQIRDFSTSATPIDEVAYATAQSQSGNDGILDFFDSILKK
jgi:hypothetical protein